MEDSPAFGRADPKREVGGCRCDRWRAGGKAWDVLAEGGRGGAAGSEVEDDLSTIFPRIILGGYGSSGQAIQLELCRQTTLNQTGLNFLISRLLHVPGLLLLTMTKQHL